MSRDSVYHVNSTNEENSLNGITTEVINQLNSSLKSLSQIGNINCKLTSFDLLTLTSFDLCCIVQQWTVVDWFRQFEVLRDLVEVPLLVFIL